MAINNESMGIAAEVAIAKSFGLTVRPDYEARAERQIVELLLRNGAIKQIFQRENIPDPVRLVAYGGGPVDFLLADHKTLSVKTNQSGIGRAAPQIIGQPSSETYFAHLEKNNVIPGFTLQKALAYFKLPDTYASRCYVFKWLSINRLEPLLNMYWQHLFDCDYLLWLFNLNYDSAWGYRVFGKMSSFPFLPGGCFTFTQTLDSWNESNTLKYNGVAIGNFQAHQHRTCLKFRFNMDGLLHLFAREAMKLSK